MHLLMTVYLPWLELVLRTVGIDRKNRFSWLNTCKVEIYKSGDLQKWRFTKVEFTVSRGTEQIWSGNQSNIPMTRSRHTNDGCTGFLVCLPEQN